MADDIVDFTVNEPGRGAMKGRYLATRKSDGFLYTELRGGPTKIRKFVDPKRVTNVRNEYEIKYIEKRTEL